MSPNTEEYPIIDGFMYNPLLRYLPMRFLPLAYERLSKFRTGSWQPRLYTVPTGDGGVAIAPGRTQSDQVRTSVSGCELIGYTFATHTDTPAKFGLVIVDSDVIVPNSSDSGYTFANGIDRYIIGNAFAPASITGNQGASGQRFILLNQPYPIRFDLLTVKLSNLSTTDTIIAQLVLYIMEPVNASA